VIKRSPLPTRDFFILRNTVARDRRISYVARGILSDVVSRPDNWRITAESLAANTVRGEGIKTIRRALIELEQAGYLERKRVRTEAGTFGWEHIFYDVPQPHLPHVSAGQTISPKPSDGSPSDGEGRSLEDLERRTVKEDVPALPSTDSARFAPEVAGTDDDDQDSDEPDGFDDPFEAEKRTDWRTEDRELLRSLLGESLTSDGSKWKPEGSYPTDLWYRSFRKAASGRMKWPGRVLARIERDNPRTGIVDWLDGQGLTKD
jgi:hypothetical protein